MKNIISKRKLAIAISTLTALSALSLPVLANNATKASKPKKTIDTLSKINHIIVIYGENRSFDNLYGMFPNANGIKNAKPSQYLQLDTDGHVLKYLPPVWKEGGKNNEVDPKFADVKLPNKPFRLDQAPFNLPITTETRDLVHRFYQNQEQINGGRNNRFAAVSDAGGLVMGYYDGSGMKLWQLAKDYTLADNFFMGTFGGSFMNHIYLSCACVAQYPNAPAAKIVALNADGVTLQRKPESPASAMDGAPKFVNNGAITPDGFAVNTSQPSYQPSEVPPAVDGNPLLADSAKNPLPPQTQTTIGDTLSAKNVSWAWYAGAWNAALQDGTQAPDAKRKVIYNSKDGAPNFQPHHQPFNYFANYAPGTAARAAHLKDGEDLMSDIEKGQLPAVTFYKPQGTLNQHPGYADVAAGDEHIASVVEKIQKSPLWKDSLIIVTYDENGGFWDHVTPPKGDRWGPGTRIPAILISPLVKKHFVDHNTYDTSSILKLITKRFNLTPLAGVRPKAGDLTAALVKSSK
ncbi:acid phosphatase [Hydromonas duriensis]|uniref:Acid phosphatase n=1 Tax=Hydromonas duriensis TaxID=1527608 RepID=A0A4R6Y544_9BURK|nr:acid phosphatase [Hydromonas duriensis]TDR30193.1 acid phosphatase [Hydromonas duriensis]